MTAAPSTRTARATSVRASALETSGRLRRKCPRRAVDSGSRTTSFTIADESRYVTRSALMRTQTCKNLRRRRGPSGDRKGCGQLSDAPVGGRHVTGHPQLLEGIARPQGHDERQRAPTVRYSECLAVFRETEHVARMLAQLSNTDGLHVLLVAFRVEGGRRFKAFRSTKRRARRQVYVNDVSGLSLSLERRTNLVERLRSRTR